MMNTAYLDNSTTTRPSGEAVSKMLTYYSDKWGSPYQPHIKGQELFSAIKEAYQAIYKLLGAEEKDTIVITSSSAESINQAFLSTYEEETLLHGKNHYITSAIDEAPSIMSAHRLQKYGCSHTQLKTNEEGIITSTALIEAMTPRTALVSIPWGNGLTGVVQPIAELAEVCHGRGVRFLVDATHVLGKLFFDLQHLPIDFLAFNGNQIHAPKGIGGLFSRQGVRLHPLIVGGIEQMSLRAGPLNVPGLVALGVAAKQALEARDYLCTEISRLKYQFEKEILKKIPHTSIFFENAERLPHISSIAFPGIVNEALLYALNRKGIYASIGGGSQQQIGYLLEACGKESQYTNSAISFSLSRETREEEMEYTVQVLESLCLRYRKASSQLVKP